VVLDAPAFLAWFGPNAPAAGRALREEYEAGALGIVVPRSFTLDVLGAAARDGWPAEKLTGLAAETERLGFERRDAPVKEVALWLERGLEPARATYAALAVEAGLPLMTADDELLTRAASVAQPISHA
jgi:predicted nucleic acid-binding protein